MLAKCKIVRLAEFEPVFLMQVPCIPIKDLIKNSQFNGVLGVNHDDYSSMYA